MNSETKTCQNCHKNFEIDASDFDFYTKIQVPPPTFCPECRFQRRAMFHNERIARTNPPKLWERQCMCNGTTSNKRHETSDKELIYPNTATHFHGTEKCPNEFETSYVPERPEIVYCEQCYNAEVV